MKSFVAKQDQVEQMWLLVDAEGAILGRMAAKIAPILMGKTKPTYTPHIDTGDYVEVETKNGHIILKPRKLIDPAQGWYWTKEWQKTEADVDKEIEKNQISPRFRTAEEGLKWLRK